MKRRRNPETELSDVVMYVVGAAITASIVKQLVDPSFEHLTADSAALEKDIHSDRVVIEDRLAPVTSDHAAMVDPSPTPSPAPQPVAAQITSCPAGQTLIHGHGPVPVCMTDAEVNAISTAASPTSPQASASTITSSPTQIPGTSFGPLSPSGNAGGSVSFTFTGIHPNGDFGRRL